MLGEPVLILNRSWFPLHITDVRRTIILAYKGAAEIVCPRTYRTFDFHRWRLESASPNGYRCLHTPHFSFRMPEVAVLTEFNKTVKRKIRFNRNNIFIRDRNTCQYCGRTLPRRDLTMDHILPLSKGGGNSWENVVLACQSCNKRKANRTPEEANMRLLRPAGRPGASVSPLPRMPRMRPAWEPFMGKMAAQA
jgi:5-methylcytosine-specific restriction endonuclease McrA